MGEENEVTYTVDESVTYDNLFVNSRLDGEVFETYTKRRKAARVQLKQNAKGRMLWNSREKGQYIKAKHGEL
jgi:hypothetical protein